MPHPFGWMYNITCTGSCSASRHAQQKILAVLLLPQTQVSVARCSLFVVFRISKAVSNEKGGHRGLHVAECSRDGGLSGIGRSSLAPATLLLQLSHRDSGITRWCSCTYGKLLSGQHLRLSLNLVLHMTSWTKQHGSGCRLAIPEEMRGENSVSRDGYLVPPYVRKD